MSHIEGKEPMIRHLGGREDRYLISTSHTDSRTRRWWLHLNDKHTEVSAEVTYLSRGHGWGFQLGRNGGESDLGLDVFAGRLVSVWLRIRSPWTKWARCDDYQARHTGIRTGPVGWVEIQIENRQMGPSRGAPWYRHIVFGPRQFWGIRLNSVEEGDQGETVVPMPEGSYPATWGVKVYERRHVRFPGTLRDHFAPPTSRPSVWLDIPGGIPHWGKGENSWDCGMNGLFGTSGDTVEDAIANAVRSTMRDRNRFGGPHDLPRPMSVSEAEQWATAERGAP